MPDKPIFSSPVDTVREARENNPRAVETEHTGSSPRGQFLGYKRRTLDENLRTGMGAYGRYEMARENAQAGGDNQKQLHLHEIRSTQAHDGSIVHNHTYKESKESPHTMPERGPVATSATPEEAGQHVAEQFGMNQSGGGQEPEAGAEPGA
jgi:hypothetical protein